MNLHILVIEFCFTSISIAYLVFFFKGGKEHGVPILVSEIHEGMPAAKCTDLYIGDAILSVNGRDLRSVTHAQAVNVLSRVYGEIQMEVLYVNPEESDDENDWENDESLRYFNINLCFCLSYKC